MKKRVFSSVEIFAGCGGSMLGSKAAKFYTKLSIERDHSAHSTLLLNRDKFLKMPSKKMLLGDIRDYTFSDDSCPDIVCGGPPCQPFSTGGQHLGPKDGRNMFPEAVRCIRELRPRAFILENVKGLTRRKFENYLEYLILQLNFPEIIQWTDERYQDHHKRLEDHRTSGSRSGLNYNVVSRVINAADYGVPQSRERFFIIGFRADEHHAWHFPEQTHSKESLLHSQLNQNIYWERHHISPPPEFISKSRMKTPSEEKLALAPWKTVRDVLCNIVHPHQKDDDHCGAEITDHEFRGGARTYKGHTGSSFDEPAKTLKAGYNGVPGGENMLRNYEGAVRYFTIREMALLQTFPLGYQFAGTWSSKIKQIGNAVPVELFRIIADSVRRSLEA